METSSVPTPKGNASPGHSPRRWISTVLGVYALIGGVVSFVGWPADLYRLTDWYGTGISIQPNASVAVTLSGAAVILLGFGRRRTAAVGGGLVGLLGASALIQYLADINFGFLNTALMFNRPWGRVGVIYPGRMGPPGSTCWTLIGIAVVLASGIVGHRARRTVPAIGLVTLGIATLSITGYLYGADRLYSIPYLTVIAFQTATFIAAVSAALIAAVPERPPMKWLTDPGPVGVVARRAVPFVIFVPIVVGWLRLTGETSGLYDTRFGVAILVLVLIALLLGFLSWSLTRISRHESAMRRSERRVADTLQSISDGFVTFDRDWRYTFVNDEAARLMLRPREELLGRKAWEIFPESVGGIAHRELHRAAAERIHVEFEDYNPTMRRWFANKAYPGRDGSLSVFFQDVTVRKRTEEALRAKDDELERITDATSILLVRCSRDLRYVFVNRACAEFFGKRRDEIVGRPIVEIMGAEAFAVIRPHVEAVLRGEVVEYESAIPYGLNRIRFMHVKYVPDRDAGGEVVGWFATVTDISDRKRAEEALREADRRKDEFLATLAHELRNPLAPVRNAVEILKLAGSDAALAGSAREMLDRQVAQMERLIEDLMEISRITGGRLELRRQRVELGAVVRHAVETCRPWADAAGHTIDVDIPPEPIVLDGDPARLAQVFGNILHNACKYTPPGGRIAVRVERVGDDVVVAVSDNGLGIPTDMLPHVFDLFTQVDRTLERSQGGLGIGLSLVKQLVELHGGQVEVKSDGPGQGTEFRVRLPASVGLTAEEPRSTIDRATSAVARRILVVDDNRDSAESLATLLQLAGHEVEMAFDGLEAVAAAERFRPELILLDLGLPKLNGFDACRQIRELPAGNAVRIVALTGWGQEADRKRSEAAGFDAHLVKPVDVPTLMDLLATLPENPTPPSSTPPPPDAASSRTL